MTGTRILPALAAGAAIAALAACGSGGGSGYGSSGGGATTAASPPGATASAPGAGAGTSVSAQESEFTIKLGSTSLHPGAYTFAVHNTGTMPHNLTIEGPGVSDQASPTLQPGDSGQVSVTLKAGTYQFFCSVDSHRDKGMQVTVQVH